MKFDSLRKTSGDDLPARHGKHTWRDVEAGDLCPLLRGQHGQRASATADVEHARAGSDMLAYDPALDCLGLPKAKPPDSPIVPIGLRLQDLHVHIIEHLFQIFDCVVPQARRPLSACCSSGCQTHVDGAGSTRHPCHCPIKPWYPATASPEMVAASLPASDCPIFPSRK